MFVDVYRCLSMFIDFYWCFLMFTYIYIYLFVIVSDCRTWIPVVGFLFNIPLHYPSLSCVVRNSDSDWLDRIGLAHLCTARLLLQSRSLTQTPSNCCCVNRCNAIRKTSRALWRQVLIKKWTETAVLLPKCEDSMMFRGWMMGITVSFLSYP